MVWYSYLEKKTSFKQSLDLYHESNKYTRVSKRENTRIAVDISRLQDSALHIPSEVIKAGQILCDFFGKDIAQDVEHEFWLSTLSSFGLEYPFVRLNKKPLVAHQRITLLDNHSVLWATTSNYVIVSSAGQVWRYKLPAKAVAKMVERLNDEHPVTINNLVKLAIENIPEAERERFSASDFIAILDRINQAGALLLVD